MDEPEPRPEPPPDAVIVTTAGLAVAAIWTIGWLAAPLAVGTVVLVLVSWAGTVVALGVAAGSVSSTMPSVPPADSAAARIAVRTIEPRPIPFPALRPAAGWSGWTATDGRAGS